MHGYFPVCSCLGLIVRLKDFTSLDWKFLVLHHVRNTKICISKRSWQTVCDLSLSKGWESLMKMSLSISVGVIHRKWLYFQHLDLKSYLRMFEPDVLKACVLGIICALVGDCKRAMCLPSSRYFWKRHRMKWTVILSAGKIVCTANGNSIRNFKIIYYLLCPCDDLSKGDAGPKCWKWKYITRD